MAFKSTSTRYGAVAITLHWVSAVAIFGLLASGTVMSGVPERVATMLPIHAAVGVLVLLLTLARIAWWLFADRHPAAVAGQPAIQLLLARLVHGLLYVAVLVLAASGIGMLALSGALAALLSGAPLPDFAGLAPRLAHGLASKLLIGLLVLHVGAALYHQFMRRDRLLARMGIGRA